jgi:4-hydroxyacetophenone monooxygenase
MIPDFPNFFTLMGPNTGLAHGGNVIFITECQTRFILACLREVLERGVGEIEVKPNIHDAHVAEVDALHAKMVWTHKGLNNWYRNANGRVFALLPYRLVDYWKMTKEFFPNNFNIS